MKLNLKNKFGERLKKIRTNESITQEELAEALDVTREFIGLVESGVYGTSFDKLERLSEHFNKPVKYFFDFD